MEWPDKKSQMRFASMIYLTAGPANRSPKLSVW